jgi:Mor family transcriptional regulator
MTEFDEFFEFANTHSKEEVIKYYGGASLYIPSFKSTFRNQKIVDMYREGHSIEVIAREFELSRVRVRELIRALEPIQPSLPLS